MSDSFSLPDENWFHRYSLADPVANHPRWQDWIAQNEHRRPDTKRRKLLEIASGLGPTAIRCYFTGKPHHLGRRTLRGLDAMVRSLGQEPPERPAAPDDTDDHDDVRRDRGGRQIVLMAELHKIPSPPYHMEVMRGLFRASLHRHYTIFPYDTRRDEIEDAIERIVHLYDPRALVMLRITPTPKSLEILRSYNTPVVLVHADRYEYPSPPVLANIVPDQTKIREQLWWWARKLFGPVFDGAAERECLKGPVVVAMPHEEEAAAFKRIKGLPPSIRNERIDKILETLAPLHPILFEVEDYCFRHALPVFESHPDASAYVCLSDYIAVGLKQVAAAAGKDYSDRIVGFDNSELAKRENIPSFGQDLRKIGKLVIRELCKWFQEGKWAKFTTVFTEVRLARGTPPDPGDDPQPAPA